MMLWFDVEKRYNTTQTAVLNNLYELWFDVEKRYNTTGVNATLVTNGCGLM